MKLVPNKDGVFPKTPYAYTLPKHRWLKEARGDHNLQTWQQLDSGLKDETEKKVNNRRKAVLEYYQPQEIFPGCTTDEVFERIVSSGIGEELASENDEFAALQCHPSYVQVNTGGVRATKFEVDAMGLTPLRDFEDTRLLMDFLLKRFKLAVVKVLNNGPYEIRHDTTSQAGLPWSTSRQPLLVEQMRMLERGSNLSELCVSNNSMMGFRRQPNKPFKKRSSTFVDVPSGRMVNGMTSDPMDWVAGKRVRPVFNIPRHEQLDLVFVVKLVMQAFEADPLLDAIFNSRPEHITHMFKGYCLMLMDIGNFENSQSRVDHDYIIGELFGDRGLEVFERISSSKIFAYDMSYDGSLDSIKPRYMVFDRSDAEMASLFTMLPSGFYGTTVVNKFCGASAMGACIVRAQGYSMEEYIALAEKNGRFPGLPWANMGDDGIAGFPTEKEAERAMPYYLGEAENFPKLYLFEIPELRKGSYGGFRPVTDEKGKMETMILSEVSFLLNGIHYEFGWETRAPETWAIGLIERINLYETSIGKVFPERFAALKSMLLTDIYDLNYSWEKLNAIALEQNQRVMETATTASEILDKLARIIGERDRNAFKWKRDLSEVPEEYKYLVEEVAPVIDYNWLRSYCIEIMPFLSVK